MKIGLFFGTFNPIHQGHLQLALSLLKAQPINQVWFVISPQSPFKIDQEMVSEENRLQMVTLALEEYDSLIPSNLEFDLERPNYTCDTLRYIKLKYPDNKFVILMGSDNYLNISKWKDHQYILNNFQICVYNRKGHTSFPTKNTLYLKGDYINVSSSYIRENISLLSTQRLLNSKVLGYIIKHSLYCK